MCHPDGRRVTIPNHRSIKRGTLKNGILNPLSISVENLIDLTGKTWNGMNLRGDIQISLFQN